MTYLVRIAKTTSFFRFFFLFSFGVVSLDGGGIGDGGIDDGGDECCCLFLHSVQQVIDLTITRRKHRGET